MLDIQTIIERANIIHNNTYDYRDSVYLGMHEKMKIICKTHGDFYQTPTTHIHGKCGCPKCGMLKQNSNNTRSKEEFTKESIVIHNNFYDYRLVTTGRYDEYNDIICPIHGIFNQTVKSHLVGHGCWECYKIKNSKLKIKDLDHFIRRSVLIHRDKYDYTKSIYVNDRTKLIVICKKHGEFLVTPNQHYHGNGCPSCKSSKGEIKVRNYLIDNNIDFVTQKKFDGCVNKRKLMFDFYIPNINACIEYDGLQHYQPYYGKVPVEYIQHNDNIKTKYCEDNGIKLIRIKYTKYDKIEEILKKELLDDIPTN